MRPLDFIDVELEELRSKGLYRETFGVEGAQGRTVRVDGRELICFGSNDYLGLASDPRVKQAAAAAANAFGSGATASRLVSGTMELHEALEHRLARFKHAEACLLFPTGYMANVGTIAALVERGDLVIADRFSHASVIDGCRLSGATFRVYAHGDASALEEALKRSANARRRLIATDGLFSMDGDLAPLRQIVPLAQRYNAALLLDDAHGTGTLGEHGRGTAEHLGVEGQIDVSVGTLSKALASLGGFVVGSEKLISYLKNRARTFIYTTASPPSVLAAALAALQIVEDEPERRARLRTLTALARTELTAAGMTVPPGEAPIVPMIVGDTRRALELSAHLRSRGFLVPAVRPPTVPAGTARLRVSLQAIHTEEDIRALAVACREWAAGSRPLT